MLLAGDVGGTKTLLGLFERHARRPVALTTRSYPTQDYSSFTAMLDAFARDVPQPFAVEAAAVGVAGPVVDNQVRLTNITWDIAAAEITSRFGTTRVRLLNDLAAMASSVAVLDAGDLATLQEGVARPDGHAVVIAAGTGLGQAALHRVNGRLIAAPSEGGHADFAARTDAELELVRMLRAQFGRAEVEHVVCGPGLVNLYRFTHRDTPCDALDGVAEDDAPARVSEWGLARRCPACVDALDMFVSAYGAEAGNLALRGMATFGVYVGGGIAPRILPALQDGRFMSAFRAKGPMTALVEAMPVHVILNRDAGLIGAAVHAQGLLE